MRVGFVRRREVSTLVLLPGLPLARVDVAWLGEAGAMWLEYRYLASERLGLGHEGGWLGSMAPG